MTFDLTKPVQTRNGCKSKIISTDYKGDQPIIAIIEDEEGNQDIETFCNDGSYHHNDDYGNHHCDDEKCEMDLINIPEQKKIDLHWGGIYKTKNGNLCIVIDPDEDLNNPHKHGISCIRVLMANGRSILGLWNSALVEHVGELSEIEEYMKEKIKC